MALVLNYVTAYQMMFGVAKLSKESKEQVVLVHGAAGGVGSAVLDLAKVYLTQCMNQMVSENQLPHKSSTCCCN